MLYRKTALRIAAPVAVLALALTACGGGDDKKDSADKPKAGANEPKAKPSPSPAASSAPVRAPPAR